MESMLINLTGAGLIVFIVWWFWMSKSGSG